VQLSHTDRRPLRFWIKFSVPLSDEDEDEDSQLPLLLPFLTKLHSILRACRFSEFWSVLNGDEEAAVGA